MLKSNDQQAEAGLSKSAHNVKSVYKLRYHQHPQLKPFHLH